jgi:hypothetical protein
VHNRSLTDLTNAQGNKLGGEVDVRGVYGFSIDLVSIPLPSKWNSLSPSINPISTTS